MPLCRQIIFLTKYRPKIDRVLLAAKNEAVCSRYVFKYVRGGLYLHLRVWPRSTQYLKGETSR